MKRIATTLLGFALVAGLAAQTPDVSLSETPVTGPARLESGWYTITASSEVFAGVVLHGDIVLKGAYVVNSETPYRQDQTNYYSLEFKRPEAVAKQASRLLYLDASASSTGTQYSLSSLGGLVVDNMGCSYVDAPLGSRSRLHLTAVDGTEEYKAGGLWMPFLFSNRYVVGASSSAGLQNSYRYRLAKVDLDASGIKAYRVELDCNDDVFRGSSNDEIGRNLMVRSASERNLGAEAVYNHGYFIVPAGENMTEWVKSLSLQALTYPNRARDISHYVIDGITVEESVIRIRIVRQLVETDVTGTDALADGWYTFTASTTTFVSGSDRKGHVVSNLSYPRYQNSTNYYSWAFVAPADVRSNVLRMSRFSGATATDRGYQYDARSLSGLLVDTKGCVYTVNPAGRARMHVRNVAGNDAEYQLGDYLVPYPLENTIITGASSGATNNLYKLTQVDLAASGLKAYQVNIHTSFGTDPYKATGSKFRLNLRLHSSSPEVLSHPSVYDQGYFVVEAGTTLNNAAFRGSLSFEALSLSDGRNDITGYTVQNVTVNDAAQTIDVTIYKAADADAAIAEARTALDKSGPGYPKAGAATRAALETAASDMASADIAGRIAKDAVFSPALAAFYAETDVELPEDGKAYRIYYIHNASTAADKRFKVLSNDEAARNYPLADLATDPDDPSLAFIVRKLDDAGRYAVVNNYGQYLRLYTLRQTQPAADAYGEYQYLSFEKAPASTNSFITRGSAKDRFGKFCITGLRADNATKAYLVYSQTAVGVTNAPFYDDTYSSVFELEEISDYPNCVTLKAPAEADGLHYATVYLPWAAELPAGVTAYKGQVEETAGGPVLKLAEVAQDGILPKGSAVVLVGGTAGSHTLRPALEAGTAVEDNVLEGTIRKDAATGAGTYALSGKFGPIGFYRYTKDTLPYGKAYLSVATLNAQGLPFSFGQTTGIDAAPEAGTPAASEAYDLAGRKVGKATRGLYIVGGKKVLVK